MCPCNVRREASEYHRSVAEPPVPPFVMDRPVLHAVVRELVEDERVAAFIDALPTRARVSEAALPPLLATLHEKLGRGLVVLLPEDADARDAADAAAWFLGDDAVGLLPSRGVSYESGLAPPPHLVGERARALHVLERGGLVCASARALAEGLPPAKARPDPVEVRPGLEPGVEGFAEELALAGYERDGARGRPRPVRGARRHRRRLPDDRPRAAARRVLRRRDRVGARVLAVHAARPPPGVRSDPVSRRGAPCRSRRADARRRRRAAAGSERPRGGARRAAGLRLRARRGAARVGGGQRRGAVARRRDRARSVPAGAAVRVRGAEAGDRVARSRGGRERARGARPHRSARRRRVPASRRGAAHAEPPAPHRGARARAGRGSAGGAAAPVRDRAGAARLRLARPRHRRPARTTRSSAAARHASAASAAARCRASPTCAPATTSSTRITASGSSSASRRRPSRA